MLLNEIMILNMILFFLFSDHAGCLLQYRFIPLSKRSVIIYIPQKKTKKNLCYKL